MIRAADSKKVKDPFETLIGHLAIDGSSKSRAKSLWKQISADPGGAQDRTLDELSELMSASGGSQQAPQAPQSQESRQASHTDKSDDPVKQEGNNRLTPNHLQSRMLMTQYLKKHKLLQLPVQQTPIPFYENCCLALTGRQQLNRK